MTTATTLLDLLSTSQTKGAFPFVQTDACFALCIYHAPYFAYQKEGRFYGVLQGCCNHWDCPKCGIQCAKREYGRIVNGCQLLAEKHKLFFITITCRGKEMSLKQAETMYLLWTNRFLTSARTKAKRSNQEWYYVQVTEKQRRGHPHSHILTTFTPEDLYLGHHTKWEVWDGKYTRFRDLAVRSDWLQKAVISAGLGQEYDISIVRTASAASRFATRALISSRVGSFRGGIR